MGEIETGENIGNSGVTINTGPGFTGKNVGNSHITINIGTGFTGGNSHVNINTGALFRSDNSDNSNSIINNKVTAEQNFVAGVNKNLNLSFDGATTESSVPLDNLPAREP